MNILAWMVMSAALIISLPLLLAVLLLGGVGLGSYRALRWAELRAVYGGSEALRDKAEWRLT